jgi:hypothetical protein
MITVVFGQPVPVTIFLMAYGQHKIFLKEERDCEFCLKHVSNTLVRCHPLIENKQFQSCKNTNVEEKYTNI